MNDRTRPLTPAEEREMLRLLEELEGCANE